MSGFWRWDKVSGFLLGFNLDDEVNVIPNRTQKSIHAKVGTFESAATDREVLESRSPQEREVVEEIMWNNPGISAQTALERLRLRGM
jgi:hypothetical protein